MSAENPKPRHYWERQTNDAGKWIEPPGSELAALRRGAGRDAGDVPEMWRFYTNLRNDGSKSRELLAEHAALTLFAIHQQSKRKPMHRPEVGLGTAMRELRSSGKFSPEAVDRRFAAAATATSFREICLHLRGLVTQLRTIDQALDYTRLCRDLRDWHQPDRLARVRRTWGGQYFTTTGSAGKSDQAEPATAARGGTDRTKAVPRQNLASKTVINL